MTLDTKINIITSIATVSAVVVALCISIVPAIWRRHKNRKLAEKRVYLSLKTINKAICEYRIYNPTHYVLNEGQIHYCYSLEELKIPVKIDITKELDIILNCIDSLKRKNKSSIWQSIIILKDIVTGFPHDKSVWDTLETSLKIAINDMPVE